MKRCLTSYEGSTSTPTWKYRERTSFAPAIPSQRTSPDLPNLCSHFESGSGSAQPCQHRDASTPGSAHSPGVFLDPTLLLNLKRQTSLPHLLKTDCGSA